MPETISDVVSSQPSSISKALETDSLSSQKFLTACLCCTCGLTDLRLSCSNKSHCCMCCHNKGACSILDWVPSPFCGCTEACFILSAFVLGFACCDSSFSPLEGSKCFRCIASGQKTTMCAAVAQHKLICCHSYGDCMALQFNEEPSNPCMGTSKMLCIEMREGFPCINADLPFMCAILGVTLYKQ